MIGVIRDTKYIASSWLLILPSHASPELQTRAYPAESNHPRHDSHRADPSWTVKRSTPGESMVSHFGNVLRGTFLSSCARPDSRGRLSPRNQWWAFAASFSPTRLLTSNFILPARLSTSTTT